MPTLANPFPHSGEAAWSRNGVNMTLVQLRSLIAIADAGLNISRAAERTNSTQPGLSKQLRHVESELGFQVFVRRGKHLVAMTVEGFEVVRQSRAVLAAYDQLQRLSAACNPPRRHFPAAEASHAA